MYIYIFIYLLTYLLFREGKGGRKKGRETSMCGCLSSAPTGDLACNPGMCPNWNPTGNPLVRRPALNPLSHTSQGSFPHFKGSGYQRIQTATEGSVEFLYHITYNPKKLLHRNCMYLTIISEKMSFFM